MLIAIDVGYSETKIVRGSSDNPRERTSFPSQVGTPDEARFSFGTQNNIILMEPQHVMVGKGAITQSRFLNRREDRDWIESDTWYNLYLASLSEISQATDIDIKVVTGLPLSFFDDGDKMVKRLIGKHTLQRQGRPEQCFTVVNCKIIPQPFGSLLYAALDQNGEFVDERLVNGKVGVVDVGGKTTNILQVAELSDTRRKSTSVDIGAWDLVRAMTEYITAQYPGLDLRDHEIVKAIQEKQITYMGERVNLRHAIKDMVAPFANDVIARAGQLWNGAKNLDAILVTGGGAHLMGNEIIQHFGFGRILEEPVFGNVLGYFRFGRHLQKSGIWSK